MQGSRFAFGPFVLDPGAGMLLRHDTPVPVGHRGLMLLAAFAGRAGEILSRSELMDAAWPGVVCRGRQPHRADRALRKLLGPSADGGDWIATVPRVGYRFTGTIEALSGMHRKPLPVPDKPSIAVLPFANVGSEPEQGSFADGLTEDLITDLSRIPGLFVIARNSSFAYKGKAMDVHRIAQELGVRYLLEGSARRAAGRVRINAQLVDAASGYHLWADRFDRDLEDIFAVQDEVTAKIVEALIGRLSSPPTRNRPKNLAAYDLCVRARILCEESPQASREAHLLLQHAIELDPDYAEAYRWLALSLWSDGCIWGEPMEPNRRMAVAAGGKAVVLDPNDAANHWHLGYVLAYERRWTEADTALEIATSSTRTTARAGGCLDLSDLGVGGRPD